MLEIQVQPAMRLLKVTPEAVVMVVPVAALRRAVPAAVEDHRVAAPVVLVHLLAAELVGLPAVQVAVQVVLEAPLATRLRPTAKVAAEAEAAALPAEVVLLSQVLALLAVIQELLEILELLELVQPVQPELLETLERLERMLGQLVLSVLPVVQEMPEVLHH